MADLKASLKNMSSKQKMMLGITVVVFLFVFWQIKGMLGGGSEPQPAITPTSTQTMNAPMNANMPGAKPVRTARAAMVSPAAATAQAAPQAGAPDGALREAAVTKDPYAQEQERAERKYLKQLSDLEQLKLERQIEETNQAIATAKLATVTAEKSTAELLTQQSIPTAGPGPTTIEQPPAPTAENGQPVPPPPIVITQSPSVPYTVVSVSMQLGKWTAVMSASGKIYTVTVGDILSPDGSLVTSISRNGVMLRKDNETRKISITSSI